MLVVQNEEPVISGVIDWQGATVRPMFDLSVPRFLDATPDELYNLKSKSTNHGSPLVPMVRMNQPLS